MGYGVFRRRPDYEIRPRRVLPLAVAAVAVVGPTLFVRPQLPQPEEVRHEHYQRRQALPPRVAGGGPPAGPQQKRLHPVPPPEAFIVRPDYEVNRQLPRRIYFAPSVPDRLRLHPVPPPESFVVRPDYEVIFRQNQRRLAPTVAGGGPPAGPPPNLRLHPVPAAEVFRKPWDYWVRPRRLPGVVTAAVPSVAPILRAKPPLEQRAPEVRYNYQARRLRLPTVPTTAAVVGPVLRRPQLPLPGTFDVRPDYEINQLRRRLVPTIAGGGPPDVSAVLRAPRVPPMELFVQEWDYWRPTARGLIKPRLPGPPTGPVLVFFTTETFTVPTFSGATFTAPTLETQTFTAPAFTGATYTVPELETETFTVPVLDTETWNE